MGKSLLWRIPIGIILTAFLFAVMSGPALSLSKIGRYYFGEEKFNTLDEVYDYQTKVLGEADRVGADIDHFTISVESPPSVNWMIIAPATRGGFFATGDFAYGKLGYGRGHAIAYFVAGVALFLGGTLMIWMIVLNWKSKRKQGVV
jgi:hypothetical protein